MKDYSLVGSLHPKHNAFDLSHNHFTTLDMGYLYPVAWFECVPNDYFTLDFQALVRAQPMIAPILNNLTLELDAYFVPTRLLWKQWEDYITTVNQGSIPPTSFEGDQPVWTEKEDGTVVDIDTRSQGLWDMLGFSRRFSTTASKELRPVDYLRRAYYFIWNEWYRDENLQEPIDFHNNSIQVLKRRAWRKDYFTAAFLSRQKGTSPSIPLSGVGSVVWPHEFGSPLDVVKDAHQHDINFRSTSQPSFPVYGSGDTGNDVTSGFVRYSDSPTDIKKATGYTGINVEPANRQDFFDYLNRNSIDLSNIATFDVSDMRDMFAIQRFLEMLMRAGSRYIEFLQSQFGVSPSDARLSIPERIGGASFNIKVSEVLQTSETTDTSSQGNQSGHGLGVSAGTCGNYKAEEFGYIIILANIQPQAVYRDRLPREMFRKSLLEQFNPHFVNLSYQAIYQRELYAIGSYDNDDRIFGYQGRYDEMREKQSYVSGDLYDKLGYYLNSRSFDSSPHLNGDFIECKPNEDIFAVEDEPKFICNFWFNVKALRPMPLLSEPGLIDHVYGGL